MRALRAPHTHTHTHTHTHSAPLHVLIERLGREKPKGHEVARRYIHKFDALQTPKVISKAQ